MLPDPTPPVPLSGTFDSATGELLLTFDLPLVAGVLDERNWDLTADSFDWDAEDVLVDAGDPFVVVASFAQGGGAPPIDVVSYLATFPDVVGQNGLPVAAFAGFPVVVI